MDELIRSLDVHICRDLDREQTWCYEEYSDQVNEVLGFHCSEAFTSDYLKNQISQMIHQGYVLFGDTPLATPVRSIYEVMEGIINGAHGRRKLSNISKGVGFDVFHSHFGHSSCIVENWVNHAKRTHLANHSLTHEVVYENLISSLSKRNKTGEWLIYSELDGGIKFWCVWLHPINYATSDNQLIKVIRAIGSESDQSPRKANQGSSKLDMKPKLLVD